MPCTRPRFGYACISELTGRTTGHCCALKHATPNRLRELIHQNLTELQAILEHNVSNGWFLFRMSSGVIPFASHPINQLEWWKEFARPFAEIGSYVRANCLRLSMHPGQYTVLNSGDPRIRRAATAELAYAARVFDALGLNAEHKIVIHLGGVYGNKVAAMRRFAQVANRLPTEIRRRLVIENDERSYTVVDALAISDDCGLPVVFDNLHDRANSSGDLDELIPRVFRTWHKHDGKPKVHFSSQARGAQIGKHAEWVDAIEFGAMLETWGRFGEFDVMLEAKRKDAALEKALGKIKQRNAG
ncbi:MAG TPA: UV DNA damage repair endonuclease UvsE [Anaerolineae bacterium]